jgi:hypothetical protein
VLPRWDLTIIFPSLDLPELRQAFTDQAQATANLEALFVRHGIGERPSGLVDEALVAVFDEVVGRYNAILDRSIRLEGRLFCLVAADVRDAAARTLL